MRGFEAWVTTVVEDKDVLNALVLANSLRRSMTKKKVVVLASPTLDSKNRNALTAIFDQVFCLDSFSVNGWIGLKDYAKLDCLNLTVFRKCVYLDPEILVLKNCDEMFDLYGDEFHAVVRPDGVDTSVFCFVPSSKLFGELVATGKRKYGMKEQVSFDGYMKDWLLNQKGFGKLDDKYNHLVSSNLISTEEFSIAKLPRGISEDLLKSGFPRFDGLMESAVLKYWKKVFEEDVLSQANKLDSDTPMISSQSELTPELLDAVAIIGISCRQPGANNLDEFWDLLMNGHEGISQVPSDRWTKDHGCKVDSVHQTTHAGFLKQPVDEFDSKFFGISPKEMEFLDPQHRLLLEVTWEALENASIDPLTLYRSHTGIFTGSWLNDYKDLLAKGCTDEFYRVYMGNSMGAGSARLSFFLGSRGPSVSTESGCSSAMVAVDLACKSLRSGETPLALACGVNLLIAPFTKDTMSFVISGDGRCKTFDEGADGFGRAEGCGVLVLKRYCDAVKDGDNIWALIRGSSCVQEGVSKSMGTPTKECEALAMKLALEDAQVHPNDVSFVEAHGTGTSVGDPLEISAIAQVYGNNRREPLVIGSVKTNIGHTESCSAISGIIKVVASLQNEIIPAHLNLKKLNPKINLDTIPAQIPIKALPWPKNNRKPRLAGVSSFGITGTDGHLIMQDTPEGIPDSRLKFELERPLHMMKICAKTEEALEILLAQYQTFLGEEASTKGLNFADIAFTANTGRASFLHRVIITAKDCIDAGKMIQSKKYLKNEAPEGQPEKICFLFTGQGSQYVGMSKQLYETSPVFRMNFDKCDKILHEQFELNMKEAIWGSSSTSELSRSLYSQTAIFCVEYALLKLWESWGIKPDFALGHSLGEFAAAVAANILSLEDAIKLVAERSRLVESLPRGKMLVLKADKETVEKALKDYTSSHPGFWLDYAALNSNEQTVLAGESEAVELFAAFCTLKGHIKTLVLDASHAFHSRLMDPVLGKYRKVAETIKGISSSQLETNCKYISGVYGKLVSNNKDILAPQYWLEHTREKVNFIGACSAAAAEGCKYFVEIGPQPILSAIVMGNSTSGMLTCLPSLRRTEENWKTIFGSLSKLFLNGWPVNWEGVDKFYSRSKLRLPTYPFLRKKFWFNTQMMNGANSFFNSNQIHPLLGCIFPNASGAKLFQAGIDLKKVEYIKDHCVGKRIIFPGAGYLEMCLAAGHTATEGLTDTFCRPSGPLTIENLKIAAPLAMDEKQLCQMQVVMDSKYDTTSVGDNNASGGMKVEVFKQQWMDGETPKWTQHAVSYFTPAPVNYDELRFRESYNFRKIREACQTEVAISDLYGKLAESGLKFGPHFQSLAKIWKGESGVLAEAKIPSDFRDYVVHPILLDAMLQAAMLVQSKGQPISALHVPVSIKKFTWLENTESDRFLIYSAFNSEPTEKGDMISVLFDAAGKIIAFMSGMEFVETTVQAMESLLEAQDNQLPPIQTEVWKAQLGPNQSRVNIWNHFSEEMFKPEMRDSFFEGTNYLSPKDMKREDLFEQLCFGYTLNGYYELGWSSSVGQQFNIDKFMADLQILPQHRKLVRYHIKVFEREGIVQLTSDYDFKVIRVPPSPLEIHQLIQKTRRQFQDHENVNVGITLYTSCGAKLASILKGKDSALNILFPQDPSLPSVEKFYIEAYSYSKLDQLFVKRFEKLIIDSTPSTGGIIRVLEVGGGTGNFTGGLLKMFKDHNLQIEYTFTDISPAFFINAEKKFEEFKDIIKYRVLNVEEDAKSQGFCPGYYDIVFGADVIHATRDLAESLTNIRQLLRPKGLLSLVEGAKENYITTLFGLLEGYWRFTDLNIRQHHPLVTGETWRNLCLSSGFDQAVAVPCSQNFYALILARASEQEQKIPRSVTYSETGTWLVFAQSDEVSRHLLHRLSLYRPIIQVWKSNTFEQNEDGTIFKINVNKLEHMSKLFASVKRKQLVGLNIDGVVYLWGLTCGKIEQADISQPYLNLCQAVVEMKQLKLPKMVVTSRMIYSIGDHLCEYPAASTLWGVAKSFANEYNTRVKIIDLDYDAIQNAENTFCEIWNDDAEQLIAYRENVRYFDRLMKTKLTEKALKLPQCDRYQLIFPQTKSIADLKFGTLGNYALKEHEIEICVKACALNFRDVFAVLKPDAQFEKINTVGSDFAGVVSNIGASVTKWKVGDQVFGCNLEDGALPSHVRTLEKTVVRMPSNLTFAECATLPAVFATSYYSLVTVAKMKAGETVLIHTASGGVGLSAIQIAQQMGVKIIATAGSCRKRAYLRNLGIEHVFHSRNTKYEQEIMKATSGKGVDIVLNSLTGPGFKESSLNVCSKNARFIEMSKLSIWQPEEVKRLRPDVDYTIVDLTSVGIEVWSQLFAKLDEMMKNEKGMAKPIPYVRFDGVHIREALSYLQKAKHIGKIVCVMPQVNFQGGHYTTQTPLFNEDSTYLITGGLGGIGFEVVKWMAMNEGAKNLVIVSRSHPKEKHLQDINQLRSNGINVITKSVDVGDYAICKKLIESIESPSSGLPPLRGVMHCAGVLSDATLMNQSWDKFLSTFRPKIKGTWNLHELTKHCNLEHFVLFSSMAATFGPPGQSNHAAGNAYLDALAHYRQSIGLPALTINWGQWSTVGIAAGKEVRGVMPFSPQRGLAALCAAMKSQRTQIGVVDLDYAVLSKVFPQSKILAQNMIGASSEGSSSTLINSEKFWKDVDSAKDDDKPRVIKKYIKVLLRQILKLDDEEPIDDHSNFQDMGLDSLMMIELKNNLQTTLGGRMVIGASALADCNNVDVLTERLLKQMNEDGSSSDSDRELSPEPKLSPEEMSKLIKEDSILPDTVCAVKDQPIMKLSEAKIYLLTGITGNLGPHILKELLKYPRIEKVYCLMRKTSNPLQRLQKILKDTKTQNQIDMGKVKIIVGDLGTPNFGLEDDEYNTFAQEVDAVVHCAVKSNHVESYGMNSMRKVNVFGTLYVLEFCSHQKTKHLFHSSSIVAVASTDEDGCLSENWPTVNELEGVTDLGYPVSKMICDRLVQQAIGRGIPCKAFRFGGLIGHSKSGTFRHYNNHIMLRFLCYMKLGAMPSVPVPSVLLPVDLSASVALKIFFDEKNAPLDIYNLCHPNPAVEQEFPMLAKEFGYEVDVVDYNEFVNRFEREGEDSLLYPFKGLYENEDRYNNLMAFPEAIRKWLESPDSFFSVKKVSKVIPDYVQGLQTTWDYVRRDLLFAKEIGLFEKFKLTN